MIDACTIKEAKDLWGKQKDVLCPGCELHVHEDESDSSTYPDEVWHHACAKEEKRINYELDREYQNYN